MRKLLTLFFVLISSISFAQEIEWQNTIGGAQNDRLTTMIKTTDGGYLIGGFSNSVISGDKSENCQGYSDYWVLKLDSSMNIEWQNTIGGNYIDELLSVVESNDGGYLLGGLSGSNISGDKTENVIGSFDYWIVKIDENGSIVWQKTIGGNNIDNLYSIINTNDGGYLLGGLSMSGISGNKTEDIIGYEDYWIVKIDSIGNLQWQNTIGGTYRDKFKSIIQTADGGFLLGGSSESDSSFDKSENSLGDLDYWIVKTDSLGVVQWENTIGGNAKDELCSVSEFSSGGYLLGGTSYSGISGDKSEGSFGSYDFWIVKVDALGSVLWQKTIGGSLMDYLSSVVLLENDEILMAGWGDSRISYSKTDDLFEDVDLWIVKTDSSGEIQWQNNIGAEDSEDSPVLIQISDTKFLFGATSYSDLSGDKTENSNGLADFWIFKITENYNLIRGNLFADLNSNQQNEPGDPEIPYLKITESKSSRFTFSQPSGFYSLAVFDTGNFEVAPDFVNLFNPVPLTHTGNFISFLQVDSLNDFAFQPTGPFNDLCISISPVGNFRSGFNANYALNYSNLGNTALIPTIVFYPDNNVSFVSASITPTTITPDSVVFVLGTMNPFQSGQITITVNVNTGLPIGTLINSGAMILPIVNDVNPGCNSSFWEVFTIGSYDPNDILVNRSFIYDYEMPVPPDLEYIIRYQNTGNDTAFTVKILNPLDTNRLDLSTLEMVATSHPADIRFVYHERNLEFVMNNILLPDSNINEPMSHGFVRYRIKPKSTVTIGDSIQNFAAIYFDFNNPVITNTAVTKIIQPTGVQEIPQGNISIFPNPTNNKFTIRLTESAENLTEVNVFNLYGQEVKAFKIAPTHTAEIDISDLAQGVYFIQLNNSNQLISKIVKY
ncbi:MAG: T9SS type A sorting domain-containing protein [Bacteroidia bacterium]|nr:T9SS type A sorting domain-containing protein [Bacteroidia bacterium]